MRKKSVTVVIVGEGITEKYFFDSLRDLLKIKPKSLVQKHTSISYLEKEIKACLKDGYDKIYCLIDMDNKAGDGSPDHRKNWEEYLKLKRQFHRQKIKTRDGVSEVEMFESYPSIELFFLYYFGFSGAEYSNEKLKKLLKEKTGYRPEEKFFIKNSLHHLFESKGGSLSTAIEASEHSVKIHDLENPHTSYTEIGLLIKKLLH